ncbi:MAG TPA: TadE/TadG family type IV pilus assembly protein [Actinospica sp.]|nr:TadE/TadG family type IV pilus assembly protein [Actinospica sp.]
MNRPALASPAAVLARLRSRCGPTTRGSAALELVIIAPVLILLLLFVVAVGRTIDARERVQDAAHSAARAATLAATAPQAEQAASQTAAQALASAGVTCSPMNVTADVGSLAPGSTIAVTVSCRVQAIGISGLELPATVSATFRSVVDRYVGSGS